MEYTSFPSPTRRVSYKPNFEKQVDAVIDVPGIVSRLSSGKKEGQSQAVSSAISTGPVTEGPVSEGPVTEGPVSQLTRRVGWGTGANALVATRGGIAQFMK